MGIQTTQHRIYEKPLAFGVALIVTPWISEWNFLNQVATTLLGLLISACALFHVPDMGTYGKAHFIGFLDAFRVYFIGLLIGENTFTEQNLLSRHGVPIGRFRWFPFLARYAGGFHIITIAPNGSGKHTDVQAPTLFTYEESILCLDPKGENAAVTAVWRRDNMKQKVFIMNPLNVHKKQFDSYGFTKSARYNPLQNLDSEAENFAAMTKTIADALIVLTPNADSFFDVAARNLLSAFIMYVCIEPGETKNLVRVRELITLKHAEFEKLIQKMAASKNKSLSQKVSGMADKLQGKTLESVLLTLQTQTEWLDVPALADSLSASDFDWHDMKTGKVTVYIILPANMLMVFNQWFRLMINSAVTEHMQGPRVRKTPILYMLDEFPALGNMPIMEKAVAEIRGYGVQMHFFLQNISQLEKNYPNDGHQTFFANTGIQQYFTPNDNHTAEFISESCGQYTVRAQNLNAQGNTMQPEARKDLISTAEVKGLPPDRQIVLVKGFQNPFLLVKEPYYKTDLIKRAKPNPFIVNRV